MLKIVVPGVECFDDERQEFILAAPDKELVLEHSLVSLSKWEAKWEKPFLTKEAKTREEMLDYFKCMTITQNVEPEVYNRITNELFQEIESYINAPMTATRINRKQKQVRNSEQVTSELIYYWMISLGVPFECQKWHLNRLITLIDVCGYKNAPPQKRSKRDILSGNAALNAARRQKFGSKG